MMLGFLILGLGGCAFEDPECAEGYRRDAGGTCQLQPVDEDTGLDQLTGTYTGPISIDVTADVGLPAAISDVCVGSVGLDREGDALNGSVTCRFEGEVDSLLGGETFEGTMAGSLQEDGSASGPFNLKLGIFGELDTLWTGSMQDDRLAGSLSGELLVDIQGAIEADVAYSGTFEAGP